MAVEKKKKPHYTAIQLKSFKEILLARRKVLAGDANRLEDEALNKSRDEASTHDITKFADLGSDNYEQEFSIGLLENQEDALREIDAALVRIKEKTYGACEGCGCRIPKDRLTAIPFARRCITCQKEEEKENGNL